MANEKRLRPLGVGGYVDDDPLTNVATTLASAALAGAPVVDTTNHLPIVLDPDGVDGVPEIAYVTAHTSGATTGTILRGQEQAGGGSAARQHRKGTRWVAGPMASDIPVDVDDAMSWGPPSAFDYEFDANAAQDVMPTGWTRRAVGGTYKEEKGVGLLRQPASTATPNAMDRAISGAAWVAYTKLAWAINPVNFAGVRIYVRNSTTGNIVAFSLNYTATNTTPLKLSWYLEYSSGAFVYNSNPIPPGGSVSEITIDAPVGLAVGIHYWRLRKNSDTSYDFAWSQDGTVWRALVTAFNPNAWLGTADQIGFQLYNTGAGVETQLGVHWLRVR